MTGAIGGTVAVYFHDSIEEMPLETEFFTISACEREPWAEDPNTSPSDYWPAITGVSHTVCPLNLHNDRAWTGIICISDNVSATPLIRAANLSSLTDCYRCPTGIHGDDIVRDANNEPTSIQWRKGFETFVSEFNLENDLGGMAAARIWGLAAFLNWTATCFTLHPTDMAEHLIPSVERLRIVFCPSSDETEDHTEQGMPWHPPTYEPEHIGRARHPVLKYILDEQHRQYSNDPSLKRLVYGAICCVIVQETYSSALVQLAKSALSWLDQCTGTDLTEEISLLETVELDGEDMARSRSVPIRRTDDIDIHGREIRENCSICDHEIEWYSPLQSQCVFGHLFGT